MAGTVLFSGCTLGPDFIRPSSPDIKNYTLEGQAEHTASTSTSSGEAQSLLRGKDIPGQWWTLFHSPQLTQLIQRAMKRSPDLQAAQAALIEA
ncbi:MAG: efflux transporter outer membrane subunit, partial [Methylobacter sp.]